MLPVMLAARRLDSEDPQTVYWLRIAYGVIQTLCILAVAYTYYKANMAIGIRNVVYVPPPPQVSECLTYIYCVDFCRKRGFSFFVSQFVWFFSHT